MTATTLPNVGVQYKWALGEDAWNTGMDANLLSFDSLVQCNIISAAETTPPVSPTLGDKYIPYTGASGAWSSLVGKVVVYNGTGWSSYTPKEGWLVYDNATNGYIKYTGAAWVADPFGDRAYADSVSAPALSTTITRGHKFGQHTKFDRTAPNGIYCLQSTTNVGRVTLTSTKIDAITGGAAISDAIYFQLQSATTGVGAALSVYAFTQSTGNVMATRWRTGDKMEALFSVTPTDLLPASGEDFVFRVGLANLPNQAITADDPFTDASGTHTLDGSNAYFFIDKDSGFWKFVSGYLTTIESTTTSVAAAIDVLHTFHVIVNTNGSVVGKIDGVTVATHNTGVINNGSSMNEAIGFRNRAGTGTANKGCILDQIEFKHVLANARTGFAFT